MQANKGYPWFVFYIEAGTHIEVWGVLHARRDIPARMSEDVEADDPNR